MVVRQAISTRLQVEATERDHAAVARLPISLKRDGSGVRTAMLKRLSASRTFALGDRAGVLRNAQRRSGRAFRLDVRQRVIVKALVSRHGGKGAARAEALAKHLGYLGRSGAGIEGDRPVFFDRSDEGLEAAESVAGWGSDRHHFRFIISPEHGDRISDLRAYTREVMCRVSDDLGQPELQWIGTCHFDTDQPHAHVVVRGLKTNGKDLVIPRDYMAYGFRARAQEVAHELLGDLSRAEAERRVWRETQASRFTGFDRRLLQSADAQGCVDDGIGGTNAWTALTRGRLRHLEALGLATRAGRRYQLDPQLEVRLRGLQLRQDIIRTLQMRRMETARPVGELTEKKVRGRVVGTGAHDELGGVQWVIVRDEGGQEHYARLSFGHAAPKIGRVIDLAPGARGAVAIDVGRGASLAR